MAQGEQLSKSKADEYLDKLFKEHFKKHGVTEEVIQKVVKQVEKDKKLEKQGKYEEPKYYYHNQRPMVDFDRMERSDDRIAERKIKELNIKTASQLLGEAIKGIKIKTYQLALTLSREESQAHQFLEAQEEAKKIFSKFDIDTSGTGIQEFKTWRLFTDLELKGMDNALYIIRGYGVKPENQSKFDKLYKEVICFFNILRRQSRRLYGDDINLITNEYIRIADHSEKAIKIINRNETKVTGISNQSYGYLATRSELFSRSVIEELIKIQALMKTLIEVNDYEKTLKTPQPNEARDLQYFYYLCWEMYKLIEDKKFAVPKYSNQKLFAEFVYHFQKRFTFAKSVSSVYDHLRNPDFDYKKQKFLNLHSIKSLKTYKKNIDILFVKSS